LTDELIAYIGVRGPTTVAEFTRRAFRDGEHGYYTGKGSREGGNQKKKKKKAAVGGGLMAGHAGAVAVDEQTEMEDDNDWDLDDDDDIHSNDDDSTQHQHACGEHDIGSRGADIQLLRYLV